MCADLPLFCGACFAGFCEFLFFRIASCFFLYRTAVIVFWCLVRRFFAGWCGAFYRLVLVCVVFCRFFRGGINENCSPEIDCPGEQFFALCYILYFFRLAQCFWVIAVLFGCRFYSAHHYFYFGCFCKELADVVFYCLRGLLLYYLCIFENVGFAVDAQLG